MHICIRNKHKSVPSHLWFIKSFNISWFPVINARSNGVNPSLFGESKCKDGCVSKIALAFSNFSCSMALHNAEKCMSAVDELAEFALVVILCTCCCSSFVIRWLTSSSRRSFHQSKNPHISAIKYWCIVIISTNEDGSHVFGDVKGVKSRRNVINFPFFNCLSSFKVKLRNYIENLAQGLDYWCIGGRKVLYL